MFHEISTDVVLGKCRICLVVAAMPDYLTIWYHHKYRIVTRHEIYKRMIAKHLADVLGESDPLVEWLETAIMPDARRTEIVQPCTNQYSLEAECTLDRRGLANKSRRSGFRRTVKPSESGG